MVSRKVNKRKTVKTKKNKKIWIKVLLLILLGLLVAGLTIGLLWFINRQNETSVISNSPSVNEPEPEPEEPKITLPNKIDFQPMVDEWVQAVGGNRSVLIYDLEREEIAANYNGDEKYSTASLYKLFVVYEGYRRIQNGEWSGNDAAGSTGYTILKCLDLAIRESHSPCAETLWAKIGHTELDEIIKKDFKIENSDISHLISNPADIMKILKIFYLHKDIKNENLIISMKDSFLNQPTTTYNWRQGLPSGFNKANVYNKVGWDYNPDGRYWNIYHDAAIVEFPDENRHFIVVVMTNRVPFERIRQFGTKIEETFYK
ncbi:serine hydrolase [Candidatus Saccharibacteria bacterium]|nr:serine hydrolase [Candidatus Saccharibacteria bacterium]